MQVRVYSLLYVYNFCCGSGYWIHNIYHVPVVSDGDAARGVSLLCGIAAASSRRWWGYRVRVHPGSLCGHPATRHSAAVGGSGRLGSPLRFTLIRDLSCSLSGKLHHIFLPLTSTLPHSFPSFCLLPQSSLFSLSSPTIARVVVLHGDSRRTS